MRGSALRPSMTRSATSRPTAGEILKPWPLKPAATNRPSSAVFADHRIPVGRDVVAARVAGADRRVAEAGEPGADLVDGEVDERLGGAVEVVVRVGLLDVGKVAVAEQDVAADLGADVLQRHEVGEHRHVARLDAGVDGDDLLTHDPDGHVDAVWLEEGLRPDTGGDDDGARRHRAAVGQLGCP